MKSKLTSTRLGSLRKCPRLHFFRYVLGFSRIRTATPLRFGNGFHYGRELHNTGMEAELAVETALCDYSTCPTWADPTEWAVERETLKALLTGHFWRYGQDNIEIVAVELSFEIPLVNPDTGAISRKFTLAGKIDAIVRLADGRLAVLEYKTAGEDISPESEYWLRLRCDGQISQYVLAARALGYDVATVLYDVTRKPTIQPRQIPLLDDQGRKIVLDASGQRVLRQNILKNGEPGKGHGEPMQGANAEKGWILQTRPETPEEYGQRVLTDIESNCDQYFQRREVPRLEDELTEYRAELWQQSQHLMELHRRAAKLPDPARAHFRNVSKMTCGQCEFSNICLNGIRVDPACPPAGYQVLQDVHPELVAEGA
jgi:hypothetical protein